MDTLPTHVWQCMYPPLQRHAHGWLDVGDGHRLYWEECGNPLGRPALFVHGGPGAGCTADDRRWFDPLRWRIVLFDQRGCGRSSPAGNTVANTTPHLVDDIERLRRHLHIERWLLFGGSWGSTLALAYAQQHAARVQALVLRGVFTATRAEQQWLYGAQGAGARHPAAWQRFTAAAPGPDPLAGMAAQLHCGDATVEQAAAQSWLRWEQDLMDLDSGWPAAPARPPPDAAAAARALAHARIGVHYARHGFYVDETQLLAGAARLLDIPGVIVQGGRDLVTPPQAAAALHQAWPASWLYSVAAAGHASSHPALAMHLVQATDHFRGRPVH